MKLTKQEIEVILVAMKVIDPHAIFTRLISNKLIMEMKEMENANEKK